MDPEQKPNNPYQEVGIGDENQDPQKEAA